MLLFLPVCVMVLCTGAPPAYASSVGDTGITGPLGPHYQQQQQQQLLASQMSPSAGYYSGAATAALLPQSVDNAGDTVPPVKF